MKKSSIIFCTLPLFLLSICSQNHKITEGYYEADFVYAGNEVEVYMSVEKQMGFITVVESSKDSLVSIQKYIFYMNKNDTISLSDESEDNKHAYLLKPYGKEHLLIRALFDTKDSLLFGFDMQEIIVSPARADLQCLLQSACR